MNAPQDLPSAALTATAAAADDDGWLPLGAAQRAVWLDLRLQADPLAYQLTGRARIDGPLDLPTLRQSITLLVARHDALQLRVDQRLPRQRLAPVGALPLTLHELPADADDAALAGQVDQIFATPIPQGPQDDAPLFHIDLLRLGPRRWELLWRCSHLVCDAVSVWLQIRHWAQAYNALLDEQPGRLPAGSSFVATLAADAAQAQGPQAATDLAHWRQRFATLPAPVFERGSAPGIHQQPVLWTLEGAAQQRWQQACASAGLTGQRALVALLALAVGQRQGRSDLTIGMALHRRDAASREVVGMLAGILPVRCRWSPAASLLQAVQAICGPLDADYRHQRMAVDAIGRAVGLAGSGQARLFDISLSYTPADARADGLMLGAARLQAQRVQAPALVPLVLLVVDRADQQRLEFELGHDPACITAGAARSLAAGLQRLVQAFCNQPHVPLAELEPASAEEQAQVLGFNPPPLAYPRDALLHALVRQQVRATPDALAVVDGEATLSYAELDVRSDALAQQISAALAGCADADADAEPVVAVALPRSLHTVVALLAILKAGAVYLPLDLAYPAQRLQYLLDDAQARLLIDADDGSTAELSARRLRDGPRPAALPALPVHADARRLAYIIYTSGSTGLPKPVGVPHRAAVNLAFARRQHDPIGPGDNVLAAISVGFDVSIGQLLLPLLSGAAIVIAPPLQTLQADAFWALLARHRVTHINSVPSFFDSVSEALPALPEAQRYRGLKRLMLGGEPLTAALVQRLRQRLPGTQIVNMYGPTEACIDASAYVVPERGSLPAALPIGRALPNYRLHVLDDLGRLLPVGVVGELCIAGDGLARGYLGRPGATAAVFVPDPFGGPGERLYRSGDLARWRDDGQLEFLGRRDQQVKIRGHRVETGEIEAVLLQHPAITQAAVIAQPDASGQNRLLAYIVTTGEQAPDDLKPWLARRLPEHMLPAATTTLPTLPLTTNGKLDRRALPLPDVLTRQAYAPPEGAAETVLATLWAELLRQPQVGRHDNFFDLGGQSLLAIGLVERLRQQGWALQVSALFAQPQLSALALQLQRADEATDNTPPVPPPGIPVDAQTITPAMLPMLSLEQAQIDAIVAQIDGGAANVQDIYPLAPLQQGILFHHLLHQQGDVYLSPVVLGFNSRAQLDGFSAALQQVINRHDMLRTSVAWQGLAEPVQVVWRSAPLAIEELPAAGGDALARLLEVVDARRHRINLQRAPMLRAVASPDADQGRWLLALCVHHLALDNSSVASALAEVQALQQGQHLPRPALPFRDVVWRARHGLDAGAHEAFFRSQLGDVRQPTAPFDLLDVQGDARGVVEARLPLPAALATGLRTQARAAGVSPASLLHLAWGLLLSRTSPGHDQAIVFGTVLFGRMRAGPGADRALGLFINTLPLRLDLARASVADALADTHQRLAALLQHEHAPLALAQRCSGVAAPAPLFTTLFNLRHSPPADAPAPVEMIWAEERTGYPLALAVDDHGQGFTLALQAVPELDAPRIARLMQHTVQQLVDALAQAPTTPCAALELLDADEQARLAGFNPPPLAYPRDALLHALVRQQVRSTPDALAVVDGEATLSYAELDVRSDALAQQISAALADCGDADPDAEPVVAVALPRSLHTVVALLAILKAGAVYLPLDLAYPAQRLQYLLDDAQARLLIDADDGSTAELSARRLRDGPRPAALPALPVHADARRLAYIIYTSGSTGLPKPVGVPHRAAVNLAFARRQHDPIGPGDNVLAAISVGFDVSIGQLLLPLLSGAAIVIAPPLQTLQADAFWALLARHRVTHINSVPSFFDSVSEALPALPEAQRYRGLKRLMLGGEPLTAALVQRLRQRLPGTQIVNMYGPTEACIDASAYVVPERGSLPAALPIGRALPNYRLHVLDDLGRLLPVGVVGELCIAGDGLARGYLGRPGATAAVFVPDPFGGPGERLYRSGDLARWRDDGQLEFLGRRDQQVKIRGHRVETGEIEAVLLQHPAIAQAAVIAQPDASGQNRLLAYIVTTGEQAPDDLKPWLARRLPEHMLPAATTTLPNLPLTTNGKLDRRALPLPDVQAQRAADHVPARDALEAALAGAWQQVFGQADIGVFDDFFALGGHSLLALRLVTTMQQALRPLLPAAAIERLTLQALLQQPSVAALAGLLRGDAGGNGAGGPLLALRSSGSQPPLFCVHPQGGTVLCYAELVRQLPADLPVWGLQASGLAPGEQPLATVDAMAQAYVQALRRVQPAGPYRIAGYSSGGVTAWAMALQLQAAGEQVQLLALLDSPLPDGSDLREPTVAEILDDARQIIALATPTAAPAQAPADVAGLRRQLQAQGLVGTGFGDDDAARMVETARCIVRATRRYQPPPAALPVLQIRTLRRDSPAPDWSQRLLGAPAETHDLDTDHIALLGATQAASVARLLLRRLG